MIPVNKKAKAIQKKRAAENTYEALQLKKSAAIYNHEMTVGAITFKHCLKDLQLVTR